MKVWAFLKVTLVGLRRDFPIMLFCFAVFPIVLSTLYGFFMREMFVPSNKMDMISISLQDNDRSMASKELDRFMRGSGVSKYIQIKNNAADIHVSIPKGYEAGLRQTGKASIHVNYEDEKNASQAAMVAAIVDRYNERMQEQLSIQQRINALEPGAREKAGKAVGTRLAGIYSTSSFKNIVLPKGNSLTSYEYYSSSVAGFMSLILIMSLVNGFFQEKETGVFNRIISTSLSKYQYFNCSMISSFVFALLVNIVYVTAFRLLGLSFDGSVGLLFLIVVCKSMAEAAVAGVVIAFFKKKMLANMLLTMVVMITTTVGGTFAPVEKMGGAALVSFSRFLPNTLIISTFKNYLLSNSFSAISAQLAAFIVVTAILYMASMARISLKWEAQ